MIRSKGILERPKKAKPQEGRNEGKRKRVQNNMDITIRKKHNEKQKTNAYSPI